MRLLAALAVGLVLVTADAPAAPVAPPPREVAHYFPTTVGARWVYVLSREGERDIESELEVTAVRNRRDGARAVTTYHKYGAGYVPYQMLNVSARGVGVVAAIGGDFGEPFWLLRTPAEAGKKWDVVLDIVGVGVVRTAKATAHGPEWVEVPAGKYRAVRVEMDLTFRDERRVTTTWYAAGIGMVKEKVEEVNGTTVEVLKSFTPGKDATP
ncbi:hypothetical protein ETAA1_25200 [Urbifossiella limnaea]|uniref:DUF3108 domain-containing protein n=2 Tax=Urbifossiella limnaea TaxID=2528023 RepID=A0A517XSV2_9BACT|nr:hypothetical protein ETAA1_25200 [Urbifossiella limnaea]